MTTKAEKFREAMTEFLIDTNEVEKKLRQQKIAKKNLQWNTLAKLIQQSMPIGMLQEYLDTVDELSIEDLKDIYRYL